MIYVAGLLVVATLVAMASGKVPPVLALGVAISIGDEELRRWVVTLAAKEGIWPEASSAAPFAAIERLRGQDVIAPHERCVALLTASGLKDPGPIESALPEPPLVSGGLPELLAALRNTYGYAHG